MAGAVARIGDGIGRGLLAGLAGTVAMTVSSTAEQRLRGREASTAPARAAKRVLGIASFESEAAETRFGTLVHWGYGTSWGAVRGLLAAAGLSPAAATAGHLAAVWGSEQVMLPALDVAPPLTRWGAAEVAIDLTHHVVYAATAGLAYALVDRGR